MLYGFGKCITLPNSERGKDDPCHGRTLSLESLEEVSERPTIPWASCLMHHIASILKQGVTLIRILWSSRKLVLNFLN